ncbi:MAG: alpha amylase family protein [bacterium]
MAKQIEIILLTFSLAFAKIIYPQAGEKVAVLWCDPLLNIKALSTRNSIIEVLNNAQNAGFAAIALGVKSLSGEVIYDSKLAPRLMEWEGHSIPITFEPVDIFLQEAKRRDFNIYAVFTVFSEGHMEMRRGPIYDKHPEWQTQVYVVDENDPKIIPITEWAYGTAAFVNPIFSEVQNYEIAVVEEFLKKYRVDGIIFDRVRFNGIESDFSDFTKQRFQAYVGHDREIQWWPLDIYELQFQNDEWELVPGEFFQDWIEFRSKSIYAFYDRLVKKVRDLDPTLPIGSFVGSWYPTYYEYGLNWASQSYIPEYDWAGRDYNKTAVADMLDHLTVGCYFPRITIEEAEEVGAEWWMSIEGAALISMEAVKNVCPVYAAVWAEQFKNQTDNFKLALETALELTNGLYIYDLSQIEKYQYWDEIASVLKRVEERPQRF